MMIFQVRDVVECVFCGVRVFGWKPNDNALEEHKKLSERCPYLRRGMEGPPSRLNKLPPDTCGPYGISNDSVPCNSRNGVYSSHYASLGNRLKSFKDWPKSLKVKPKDLAEAGFFYTGTGDKTMCFYCGMGCKDWEETDDPWVEHAKWAPKCQYVLWHKSEDFARECQAQIGKVDKTKESQQPIRAEEVVEEEVDDKIKCKICYAKDVKVAFVPCGHTACVNCSFELNTCHICRSPIENRIRLYI